MYTKNNRSGEDYLEAILILSDSEENVHRIDIARRLGVSQPAVQKAVKLLIDGGYVVTDGMHIRLTPSGENYARSVYSRHCVIRDFLILHGVNAADADADACEMEHVVSASTFDMMKDYVSRRGGLSG